MHYLRRANSSLAVFSIIIFLLSILMVPAAMALPSSAGTEIEPLEARTVDNKVEVTPRPRSKLHRVFTDWIGGNKARIVAEATQPHIKRWHGRRKYRGVHH